MYLDIHKHNKCLQVNNNKISNLKHKELNLKMNNKKIIIHKILIYHNKIIINNKMNK